MEDQELKLLHFVMREEAEQWKRVTFGHDKVMALRSDGTLASFDRDSEAIDFIRARAMEAAFAHYHQEAARALEGRP